MIPLQLPQCVTHEKMQRNNVSSTNTCICICDELNTLRLDRTASCEAVEQLPHRPPAERPHPVPFICKKTRPVERGHHPVYTGQFFSEIF
jgi:hypothetical protein